MAQAALRWLSLVAVVWLQFINGTNTNFPAYSSELKQLLSMSQLQLNNLAFASDAGKILGCLAGFAADHLPFSVVLIIGSILGSLAMEFSFYIICWINTVCYIVVIRNFPSYRQIAVGISTSYIGLSAKIFTDIVDASYRCRKGEEKGSGFIVMFVITIATGIYAVISSLGSVPSGLWPVINLVVMAVLVILAPLTIPLGESLVEEWGLSNEEKVHDFPIKELHDNRELRSVEEGMVEEEVVVAAEVCDEVVAKEEIGLKTMLSRLDFWLYFLIIFWVQHLGWCSLTTWDKYQSLVGIPALPPLCLCLQHLGSLTSHAISSGLLLLKLHVDAEWYITSSRKRYESNIGEASGWSKYVVSRPASLVALMAPISGAFFILVNPTNLCLYISTAIIGVCTGAISSIAVSLTSDLFGTTNFGLVSTTKKDMEEVGGALALNAIVELLSTGGHFHSLARSYPLSSTPAIGNSTCRGYRQQSPPVNNSAPMEETKHGVAVGARLLPVYM
ncbi:Protein nuclear fusion defective 4 [Vitis vinifera]|uniref:Protein nuclear fusion defective 4 n=1 Tax=Vitis vinifera TaxID=29760 RepID=A0A438FA55_VITVI|nr:Protein nuclear fusion defective 4 [Vitis vinifera]